MHYPVPKDQIPTIEFHSLINSNFFSWLLIKNNYLYKALSISFLLSFPFVLIISNGSRVLHHDIIRLITVAICSSLLAPLILIARQLLGWNYILKRLISEKIIHEKSGWYDGKSWDKPIKLRAKDLLIAQQEVRPVTLILQKALYINLVLLLFPIIIYQLK